MVQLVGCYEHGNDPIGFRVWQGRILLGRGGVSDLCVSFLSKMTTGE